MSKIEWTGETWNPVLGCSIVSPGCTNCYPMRMAARLEAMGQPRYEGLTKPSKAGPVWTGKVVFAEQALFKPARRKTPTTYFVNSMSDLFHEDVPDEWIDRIFTAMALSPQHTFQILTKRAARMRAYMTAPATGKLNREGTAGQRCKELHHWGRHDNDPGWKGWPLPNVWLGVSTERQKEADERIPDLLATPAAVRFVSAEPLLGAIDFTRCDRGGGSVNALPRPDDETVHANASRLDWVIVGGESGHGAREFKLNWARDIVRQCREAGVAVFVKQVGANASDTHNGLELPVGLRDRKGGDMAEWPESLRVREMPV